MLQNKIKFNLRLLELKELYENYKNQWTIELYEPMNYNNHKSKEL